MASQQEAGWGASAGEASAGPVDRTDGGQHMEQSGEQPADAPIGSGDKEADLRKARDAGWTETTAFNYGEYQRTGGDSGDWLGDAAKYEWDDTYGDVAPAVPELEKILFHGEFLLREGAHREHLSLPVEVAGSHNVKPVRSFADAGLHPVVLANVELCQYREPSPIQSYAIPAIALGHDIVATAQTGSGKTAAYLIPVISKLMGKAKKLQAPRPQGMNARVKAEPLVLIIVPARELAIQIFDEARRLCYRSMLRPCVSYGGLPIKNSIDDLQKGCDILIGTPGRLADLAKKPHVISMNRVKFTVLDEADEMLHDDWAAELKTIMSEGDANDDADHQYLMFSATFPKAERAMAREYMESGYLRIQVGKFGQTHKNIRQHVIEVDRDSKQQATYDLLFASEVGRTLIFCNSKIAVDYLDDFLFNRGMPTTSIHSDRGQREREDAIRAFRTGKAPILIATGVSARGLDILDIKHVINYDLPSSQHGGIDEYIHRIGRTARMGHQGLATSFFGDRDDDLAAPLVKILMQCDCEVPEFLAQYIPEDGKFEEENTDDEAEGETEDGGAATDGDDEGGAVAWGGDSKAGADDDDAVAGGWVADASTAAPAAVADAW